MFDIGILTTDRSSKSRTNYIFNMIDQMERNGVFDSPLLNSVVIFIDGSNDLYHKMVSESVITYDKVSVESSKIDLLGSAGNAQRAHEYLSMYSESDWILMMEDDLIPCVNFLERVDDWLRVAQDENRLVYLLGVWEKYVDTYGSNTTKPYFDFCGHDVEDVIHTTNIRCSLLRGSQCYAMKPEHSKEFAQFIMSMKEPNRPMIHHDMRIRQWLNTQTDDRVFVRAPNPKSFVQHIGKESSVYDVKTHIDPWFYFIDDWFTTWLPHG